MKWRRFFWLLVLVLLSCSDKNRQVLRLGTNSWPGYEPLYLASSLKMFRPDQIQLVSFPAASGAIRAFRNGTISAATLTLDEAFRLEDEGIHVKVILALDISRGGDVILARPSIGNMGELKGRLVAVEATALGAYVLTRALELHQLDLADLQIQHLEVSEHEIAYQQKRVDAVVTFEPVRTRLLKLGAREIFSSRQIPNEIIDVLVVREDYCQKNPQIINQLLSGWFAALDYIQKNPAQAMTVMASHLALSVAETEKSFELIHLPDLAENLALFTAGGDDSIHEHADKLMQILQQNKMLSRQLELSHIFAPEYLAGAASGK